MLENIKKLMCNFIALVLLGGVGIPGTWAASFSTEDENPEKATLYVGVESNRYPLVYYDLYTHKLTGFDVEYATELCNKLHRKCQLVVGPYTDLVRMLIDRRVDVLVASLNDIPQHRVQMALSDPYYISHTVLMCRFPLPASVDGQLLRLYVVGGKEGSKQLYDLQKVQDRSEVKGVVPFDSYSKMFKALLNAEIDCMLADSHSGYDLLKTASEADSQRVYFSTNLKFIKNEFNRQRIAVRGGDIYNLRRVNRVIDEIDRDGTHQRLSLKYFPFTAY